MLTVSGYLYADHRVPSLDYNSVLAATRVLTKDIQEIKRVFRLMLFNILSHNKDDHAKNFSFLGDKKIWIENHPYASFVRNSQRPSRITIYKANEKLKSDRVKNMTYPLIDGNQFYLSAQTQTQPYFRVIGDGSLSTGATHKINITINNDITMGNGIPNNWENEIN